MVRNARGTGGVGRRRLLPGVGAALGGVTPAPWAAGLGCRRSPAPAAADNPGDWFFLRRDLYHLVDGMARVFRYVCEAGVRWPRP